MKDKHAPSVPSPFTLALMFAFIRAADCVRYRRYPSEVPCMTSLQKQMHNELLFRNHYEFMDHRRTSAEAGRRWPINLPR